MKRALITGIGGQDGSYLADILLENGYEVHGLVRRSSYDNTLRIKHCIDRLILHQGDILDSTSIYRILKEVHPDVIFHEADQDNVDWSFKSPDYSMEITAGAVANLLETVRMTHPQCKVFIPCSAMMFGDALPPQDERTRFNPLSPYACAKVAAFHLARYYRQAYNMFISTAILYNHDSTRRGDEYLLHKICKDARHIAREARLGAFHEKKKKLILGSDSTIVDIGCAHEYMIAVHKMMQQDKPLDLVLASNNPVEIGQIVKYVLLSFGLSMDRFLVDPSRMRPGPETCLIGKTDLAFKEIEFSPKITWKQLCNQICETLDRSKS